MADLETIQSEFADLDLEITDDEVLEHLHSLCQKYKIDATKISCEYFSFNTKTKALTGQPPTLESLATFENEKLKALKKDGQRRPLDPIEGAENLPDCPEIGQPGTPTRLVTKRQATPDKHTAKRLVSALGTPVASLSQPSSPAVVSKKFTERSNRGEVVVRHNADLEGPWESNLSQPLELVLGSSIKEPYRFMFERLRDRAAILDETICSLGERLLSGLGKTTEDLLDSTTTNTEPGLVVGRVLCDGEGRMNSNSVLLQGSVDTCGGATVSLDLSQAPSFSLFPGQVVAVECTNPNGSRLVVSKVHSEVALEPPSQSLLEEGEVLSVLTACGPFSTSDSCGLEPLADFLSLVKQEKPAVALLLGPFLDLRNSVVEGSGDSYDSLWMKLLSLISTEIEGLPTEVVLVPSYRDVHSHPVYPQPPFLVTPDTASLYRPNLRCVSDPCTITLRGVQISLSSTDILFQLGKEEVSFPPRSGDRMGRLASHLLHQASFYPLYPPNEEVNVDYEHLESHARFPTTSVPHLLLLPSDLTYFVREVSGCTVVNPGRLTKGPGPGTLSRLQIRKGNEKLETKVEIVRI